MLTVKHTVSFNLACVRLNALVVLHGHCYHPHLNLLHHQNRSILLNTTSPFPSPTQRRVFFRLCCGFDSPGTLWLRAIQSLFYVFHQRNFSKLSPCHRTHSVLLLHCRLDMATSLPCAVRFLPLLAHLLWMVLLWKCLSDPIFSSVGSMGFRGKGALAIAMCL